MNGELGSGSGGSAFLAGSGADLLLLPGFGCGYRVMMPLVTELAAGCRVLVPDHRGMGSAAPATAPYAFADLAADDWAAADGSGMAQPVIAGTSMGGLLAQLMAIQAPQRVRALVLMCTLSTDPVYLRPEELDDAALRALFARPEYPQLSILNGVACDFPKREPQVFQALVAMKARDRAHPEQAVRQAQAFRAFMAQRLALEQITCPVLVLTGADDRIVDPRNSAQLGAALPQAQVQVLPGTGHLFFLEAPQTVAALILRFLEQL